MAENETDDNAPANANGGGTPPTGADSAAAQPPKPQTSVLSLAQLIGAPISALVDAEAQSAMATARFIRQVGFTGHDMHELGDLQMARFKQTRLEDGQPRTMAVEIPLLSMLPIPAMQIRDAELDYTVRIVQTETTQSEAELTKMRQTPDGEPMATLRASFARDRRPDDRRTTDMLLKMKVRIEQADMPDGLAKLLAVSTESIQQRALEHESAEKSGGGDENRNDSRNDDRDHDNNDDRDGNRDQES